MEINAIEILGLVAAVCTSCGFLPQIVKTWRTKDVTSLSLPMYLVICFGQVLWLIYGFYIDSVAVVAANVFAIAFTFTIVVFILKYRLGK